AVSPPDQCTEREVERWNAEWIEYLKREGELQLTPYTDYPDRPPPPEPPPDRHSPPRRRSPSRRSLCPTCTSATAGRSPSTPTATPWRDGGGWGGGGGGGTPASCSAVLWGPP